MECLRLCRRFSPGKLCLPCAGKNQPAATECSVERAGGESGTPPGCGIGLAPDPGSAGADPGLRYAIPPGSGRAATEKGDSARRTATTVVVRGFPTSGRSWRDRRRSPRVEDPGNASVRPKRPRRGHRNSGTPAGVHGICCIVTALRLWSACGSACLRRLSIRPEGDEMLTQLR